MKKMAQNLCIKCKNPTNGTIIAFCKNCFINEIINECYSSFIQSFDQQDIPEKLINGNITIINFKNEKFNLNLDQALAGYNKNFPGENLNRKTIIFELKKRICIACRNDLHNKHAIGLPCKCRICSIDHLNQYLSFYKNYSQEFICVCKVRYNKPMMIELAIINELNENNKRNIILFFQNKLNRCCCKCAKTTELYGQSNTLVCLENEKFNDFIHSLLHYFCKNCCRLYQNTQFQCQICNINHFWISN